MSIPDPPWKRRTRPCPFYSQGLCVFAESCGFLHDVKIKSSVDRELISPPLDADSSGNSTSSMVSIVKPPPTVSVHSPTPSSSSAHSPRMASLLSALQGIIGPLSPENAQSPASGGDADASDIHPLHDAMQCTDCYFRGTPDDVVPVQACQDGVDNDLPEDPQRDPIPPLDLLSPVQIGSVPPVPFPHVALGATLSRGDSVDSGFAETWVGPTPFSLSPPQLNQRNSTLDLLSSPFGSPLSRVLPRRISPSLTQQRTTSPAPRDSIDIVSPPVSATWPQNTHSSDMSLDSITFMYATEAQQSPIYARPFEHGGTEDNNPSNEIFGQSDSRMGLSVGSPTRTLFFPGTRSEIPKHHTPMVSHENLVDTQLAGDQIPCKDSSSKREEGAPSAIEGTVEASLVLEQPSSVQPNHVSDALPSPLPSRDSEITSPLRATVHLQSPITLKKTAEVGELDYEALYQSLVMSPEEAVSKRMSWASRLSPRTLPPRAASTGGPSAACPTPALVDIPERPHSAVDVLPWSHQWETRVTPVLAHGYTSRTSSPLAETPMSSGSSQADASASSVRSSPVSLSALGPAAHPLSTSSSRRSWLPAGISSPQSAPISAPRGVTSTLNNRLEIQPARSKWNHISTSRKVPFGFRRSLVTGRDHSPEVALRARKRPSVLTLPTVPFTDHCETPGSARSFTSESPQLRPSWARPLHLTLPSESGSPIHRLNSRNESPTSAANTLSSPSYFQHHSLASSPHSSHFSQSNQVHNSPHPEPHLLNSPVPDTLQLAPPPHSESWHNSHHRNTESTIYHRRSTGRLPEETGIDDNTPVNEDQLRTITRGPMALHTTTPPGLQPTSSVLSIPPTSTTTPEHGLMFAIASDDAKSVHHVLEHGHADPNESMGPQSALAFALTNDCLAHKLEIVKVLLAYGADPAALRNPELNPPHRDTSASDDAILLSPPPTTTLEVMDPAMRYYVSRADAPQTRHVSKLLQQSLFRTLSRICYEIVGQDQVFEQLFSVLNRHSRGHSISPLVILLCGPSGHGKSFLARRFGSLLGIPTHTVNVTTLRSTYDLWDSYSMSPYEELSMNTLSQFLIQNDGKRCVVVLDEIEKVEDPKVLYSLLMPWELGRCSPLAGHHHIDVRQVIWLGTSNVGHDLVFEFCGPLSGINVTREEYLELAQLLRPRISQRLGASLSSRVTTVLPFVPFTTAELMAIATEAFYSLGDEKAHSVSCDVVEGISRKAIERYIPEEGARSLHRAVSSLLTDIHELVGQSTGST